MASKQIRSLSNNMHKQSNSQTRATSNSREQTTTKTSMHTRRPASSGGATTSGVRTKSSSKKGNPGTYKDWQVKEESNKIQKRKPSSGSSNAPLPKKRPGTATNKSQSNVLRQEINTQFNNFVKKKDRMSEREQTEYLEIKTMERNKSERAQLLKDQKIKRKQDLLIKKQQEEAEQKKKQDAVNSLNDKFKSQTRDFQRKKARMDESMEKQKKIKKLKIKQGSKQKSEMGDKSQRSSGNNANASKGLNDLRDWINDQLQRDDAHNLEQTLPADLTADAAQTDGSLINKSVVLSDQKTTMKKNKSFTVDSQASTFKKGGNNLVNLPGNNFLSEQEDRKLGVREDRYGVFGSQMNEFDRVVEIEREKLHSKLKDSISSTNQNGMAKEDQKKSKAHLNDAIKDISKRTGLNFYGEQNKDEDTEELVSEQEDIEYDDSEQKQISDDSCDKIPVKQPKRDPKREMVLAKAKENTAEADDFPGVTNTRTKAAKMEQLKREKDEEAALVVQKWFRGHKGRKLAIKRRARLVEELDAEYDEFENRVKNNQQYNLNKYLKEKEKLRQKNRGKIAESMEEVIEEDFGESMESTSVQLQNFFANNLKNERTDKDPLSLIAIYAQRHAKLPGEFGKEKDSSGSIRENIPGISSSSHQYIKSSTKAKGVSSQKDVKKQVQKQTSSQITEEIYTESFDESGEKSSIPMASDSIPESIIGGDSKDKVSSSNNSQSAKLEQKFKPKTAKFNQKVPLKKPTPEVIEEDSIIEESIPEVDKSDDKVSEIPSAIASDIEEDSIIEVSRSSVKKKAEESMIDESIAAEYEDDFESVAASQSLAARNKVKFAKFGSHIQVPDAHKPKSARKETPQTALQQPENVINDPEIIKFEEQKLENELKRKKLMEGLMDEIKTYEQASVSTCLVERMEKIITTSLAQKDRVIMAQRLTELELEKKHKDEINKIREEQIRLMSQLMLLGNTVPMVQHTQTGNIQGLPMSSQQTKEIEEANKQRQQIMDSIQQLIEKPIEIKHEIVNVNVSQEEFPLHSVKKTYLEEHDEEMKRKGKEHARISASVDSIQEDINMRKSARSQKSIISFSESRFKGSVEEDDIIDEVPSESQQSASDDIRESIEMSASRSSRKFSSTRKSQSDYKQPKTSSSMFNNNAFDDYKKSKYQEVLIDNTQMNQFLKQIETAIEKEQSKQEKKLNKDLNRKAISPRTFERKRKDLDRWVANERYELKQKQRKIVDSCTEMGTFIKKLETDKKEMLQKIGSPSRNRPLVSARSSDDISENSGDSDKVKKAIQETRLLNQGIIGTSAETKYIQKKRATAEKLLEQKEKAIQLGLAEKMKTLEGHAVEEMLQKALEIDVEAEVNKRFEMAKKMVEDGANLESARSALSHSHKKKEKKVVIITPREQASEKYSQSFQASAVSKSQSLLKNDQEDSIMESINVGESLVSSFKASQSAEKKDTITTRPTTGVTLGKTTLAEQSDSIIESYDQYSEDFEQSIQSKSSSATKSVLESKNLLQKKAQAIEESQGYSENFEDDMEASVAADAKDKQKIMDQVKEVDSIEESIEQSSQTIQTETSGKKSKQQPLVDSVSSAISDDIEILKSVQSVEWHVNLDMGSIQQSARSVKSSAKKQESVASVEQSQAYEEDFEEDIEEMEEEEEEEEESEEESMNERDELNDLESCPDNIANSVSQSDDIQIKADQITEELMGLILDDYVTGKVQLPVDRTALNSIDEDEYKDKFPWTLDKIEEKPKPKPVDQSTTSQSSAASSPQQTAEQKRQAAEDAAAIKKHEENQQKVRDQHAKVEEYLDFLIKRIDKNQLVNSMDTPIEQDPLKMLARIQAYEEESQSLSNINDLTSSSNQQILPQTFFNKVDKEFFHNEQMRAKKMTPQSPPDAVDQEAQERDEEIQNVHHFAIFEALNEALDQERPYKYKGEPMPWSKQIRVTKQETSISQANTILERAKQRVLKWDLTGAGTKYAPLPPPPPPNNDDYAQPPPPPITEGEEERRNNLRQERLGDLLTKDIQETDELWTDYEIEDTQVRFDLADMILAQLSGELAEFLNQKLNNRH